MTMPTIARTAAAAVTSYMTVVLALSLSACDGSSSSAPSGSAPSGAAAGSGSAAAPGSTSSTASAPTASATGSATSSASAAGSSAVPGEFKFTLEPAAANIKPGPVHCVHDGKQFSARKVEILVKPENKELEVEIKDESDATLSIVVRDPPVKSIEEGLARVASGKELSTAVPNADPKRGTGSIWMNGTGNGLGAGFHVAITSRTAKPYDRAKKGSQQVGTASGRLFFVLDLSDRKSPPTGEAGCSGEFTDVAVWVIAR